MPRQMRLNPFRPNSPIIEPEFFAGRHTELRMLIDSLYQTGNGNPKHTIITGPRGIGKSSIANQVDKLAEGKKDNRYDDRTGILIGKKYRSGGAKYILSELDLDPGDFYFDFLVSKHRAQASESIVDVVASLARGLPVPAFEAIQVFLNRWKVSLSAGPISAEYQGQNLTNDLSSDFIKTLKSIWDTVHDSADGIILIIDEIDAIASSREVASFLKVTTEALSDRKLNNIAIFLVGISGAMQQLSHGHPSVSRVFNTIELRPMSDEESAEIIQRSLRDTSVTIDAPIVERITKLSVGYPAPIHLLGYQAFEEDQDDIIDQEDFDKALEKVITRIKREEFEQLFQSAGSGEYPKILSIMADHKDEEVPLSVVSKRLKRPSNELSSYMSALQTRGVVTRVDRALYRITDPLLRIYIQRFGALKGSL